jgi:protein TonB
MPMIQRPVLTHLLRGTFLTVSLVMHGLAFAAFMPRETEQDAPIEGLELSLAAPQGETVAEETDQVDSSAQTEAVASIPQAEPPPPPVPVQEEVEAAKVEDQEAPAMEAASKPPEPTPPIEPPPPEQKPETPVEKVQIAPSAQASAAAEETFAKRDMGVENGLRQGGGVTRAAYAAAVKKAIAKNRRRVPASRHGTVSVSFVIGPVGKVETVHVVKAVSPILDDTARDIIAAIHLPPPPGGTFSGTIAIKFE